MSYRENLDVIGKINDEFRYCKSIESLFELDLWSGLPPAGGAYRQQMAAYVGTQKNALFQTAEARRAADYFSGVNLKEIEDPVERGLIRSFRSRFNSATRVPEDLVRLCNLLKADVMNAWKEAREKKEYHIFEPWLEQVFFLKKQIAQSVDPNHSVFDTMIGSVDEGLKSEEVSREFEVLKTGIRSLTERILASPVKADASLLAGQEDVEKMSAFARRLAEEAGYDQRKGGFNHKVVHGFTSFLGPQDARVSTQRSGSPHLIFTCLHEAGHAMYASGGNDRVNQANMWGGIEGSFHEANARFYENIVGRSLEYWNYYYPQLQKEFKRFAGVTQEEFYRAMHVVRPSLRRIEADEVTYSLHAILRFELERDYFAGTLKACDMADAWNDKYEEYLGIRPSNDTEGVLQDMHWAGDYIGYFQSYALGNIYDGQIRAALLNACPEALAELEQGNFKPLNTWMQEQIWQYGCSYTSGELMEKLTGNTLDAKPFLQYLEEKYTALYQL